MTLSFLILFKLELMIFRFFAVETKYLSQKILKLLQKLEISATPLE